MLVTVVTKYIEFAQLLYTKTAPAFLHVKIRDHSSSVNFFVLPFYTALLSVFRAYSAFLIYSILVVCYKLL